MPPSFVACVLAWFSIGCAFLLCRLLLFRSNRILWYFAPWVFFAPLSFFVSNPLAFFSIALVFLAVTAVLQRKNGPAFFAATFPSVSGGISWFVPFPGINYLVLLDFAKLTTATLLGPTLLSPATAGPKTRKTAALDRAILLFFFLSAILVFRGLPITSGFRQAFDLFLLIVVPYFSLSRNIGNWRQFQEILKAFVIIAVILCFVEFLSVARHWSFYQFIPPGLDATPSTLHALIVRYGFMRTSGPINSPLMGMIFAIALVALEFGSQTWRISRVNQRLVQGILGLGVFLTLSRGAWLGTLVTFLAYGIIATGNKRLKIIAWLCSLAGLGYLGLKLATSGNVYGLDPYGTFQYRVDLFMNSLKAIGLHPFFGSVNFMSDAAMQASRQGQGIIDIVNTYLQIALQYGLVTLAIFCTILALVLRRLFKTSRQLKRQSRQDEANACNLMIAVILGYMAFIATISQVSLIAQYVYVLVGIGAGVIRLAAAQTRNVRAPQSVKPPNRRYGAGSTAANNAFSKRDAASSHV